MKQSKLFLSLRLVAGCTIFICNMCFIACTSAPENPALPDTTNLARQLSEELKCPAEHNQFLWFYSAFINDLTHADSTAQLNKYINKEHRLTIIYSKGALPEVKRTDDFRDLTQLNYTILNDTNLRSETPRQESLPVRDCDQPGGWNKTGCFTQESNPMKATDLWAAAGVSENDLTAIRKSAATITRTVINTRGVTFYFSLLNGTWYLTFVDVRPNCAA